jgi:hypothetical protein
VQFARPFRFGAITINATPQLFVRVVIEVEGSGSAVGASAELLVPKWFDKRPELSPAQTVDGLRLSLEIARGLYLARTGFLTAFDLHASCMGAQVAICAKKNIPPLAAAYGPAEIDKAILDALLRAVETNFFDGMAGNIAGIDARLSSDLADGEIAVFLAGRKRLPGSLAGITVVREPFVRIQTINAALEDFLCSRWIVRNKRLLDPDGQRELRVARRDILPRAVGRLRCRGAAALDIHHRYTLRKKPLSDQG